MTVEVEISSTLIHPAANMTATCCSYQQRPALSPTFNIHSEENHKKPVVLSPSARRLLRKRASHNQYNVSFNERANRYYEHDSSPMDEQEIASRWYSNEESAKFKERACRQCKILIARGDPEDARSPKNNLGHVYNVCFERSQVRNEYDNAVCKQLGLDQCALTYHAQIDHILGLERLLVSRLRRDRAYLRRGFLDIVKDLKASGAPQIVIDTNIARVSQELSKPSRFFATWLGHVRQENS